MSVAIQHLVHIKISNDAALLTSFFEFISNHNIHIISEEFHSANMYNCYILKKDFNLLEIFFAVHNVIYTTLENANG